MKEQIINIKRGNSTNNNENCNICNSNDTQRLFVETEETWDGIKCIQITLCKTHIKCLLEVINSPTILNNMNNNYSTEDYINLRM